MDAKDEVIPEVVLAGAKGVLIGVVAVVEKRYFGLNVKGIGEAVKKVDKIGGCVNIVFIDCTGGNTIRILDFSLLIASTEVDDHGLKPEAQLHKSTPAGHVFEVSPGDVWDWGAKGYCRSRTRIKSKLKPKKPKQRNGKGSA